LADVLRKRTKLFSGKLGIIPKRLVHLELEPGGKPKSSRPYGVPRQHELSSKKNSIALKKSVSYLAVEPVNGLPELSSFQRKMAEYDGFLISESSTK
jgi:hypothetical protein